MNEATNNNSESSKAEEILGVVLFSTKEMEPYTIKLTPPMTVEVEHGGKKYKGILYPVEGN